MIQKATLFAALIAAASLHFGGTAANAAPVGPLKQTMNVERTELQQVDWRPYRHCHWKHGRKWCHGARRHGYINPGTGVSVYIGRPRHGHHNRHHYRHHRR